MGRLICVFGNSHIGALALSSRNGEFAERGDDLRYWGLGGGHFPKFRYRDGKILSGDPAKSLLRSGWCEHLDLSSVDVLVCYGFHISPSFRVRAILHSIRKNYGLSRAARAAVRDAMIDSWWGEHAARILLEDIRRGFPDLPMLFYAHPHVAAGHGFYDGFAEDEARSIQAHLLAFLDDRIGGLGITYRPQPEATVEDDLYTARVFNTGALKFGSGEKCDEDDFRHMNALYGDHILGDLIGQLY